MDRSRGNIGRREGKAEEAIEIDAAPIMRVQNVNTRAITRAIRTFIARTLSPLARKVAVASLSIFMGSGIAACEKDSGKTDRPAVTAGTNPGKTTLIESGITAGETDNLNPLQAAVWSQPGDKLVEMESDVLGKALVVFVRPGGPDKFMAVHADTLEECFTIGVPYELQVDDSKAATWNAIALTIDKANSIARYRLNLGSDPGSKGEIIFDQGQFKITNTTEITPYIEGGDYSQIGDKLYWTYGNGMLIERDLNQDPPVDTPMTDYDAGWGPTCGAPDMDTDIPNSVMLMSQSEFNGNVCMVYSGSSPQALIDGIAKMVDTLNIAGSKRKNVRVSDGDVALTLDNAGIYHTTPKVKCTDGSYETKEEDCPVVADPTPDTSPDTADTADSSDASDASDTTDTSDSSDLLDTADTVDSSDASDTTDAQDSTDPDLPEEDTTDSTDTSDTAEDITEDTSDTIEDSSETTDTSDTQADTTPDVIPDITTDTAPDTTPDVPTTNIMNIIGAACQELIEDGSTITNIEFEYDGAPCTLSACDGEDLGILSGKCSVDMELHDGFEPVRLIVTGDSESGGSFSILKSEYPGVLPVEGRLLEGEFRIIQHDHLPGNEPQIVLSVKVGNQLIVLGPVGTDLWQKIIQDGSVDKYLGSVYEGIVRVTRIDSNTGAILETAFLPAGSELNFTSANADDLFVLTVDIPPKPTPPPGCNVSAENNGEPSLPITGTVTLLMLAAAIKDMIAAAMRRRKSRQN